MISRGPLQPLPFCDSDELSHCLLHGNGFNRWFDKSISLIITGDGRAGINFEHSWGDGVAVLRFVNEVYRNSTRHPALLPHSRSAETTVITCERLEFKLNDSIQSAIHVAHEKFDERKKKMSMKRFKFRKFGKDYIVKQRMSPDAIFQLACQITFYRQFGRVVPSYEACSTAAFKHGRTETIRPTSMLTKQCSQAIVEERGKHSVASQDLLKYLDLSLCCYKQTIKDALRISVLPIWLLWNGFDRHLFALKHLAVSRGEPTPDFFLDTAYQKINHNVISTSTLQSPAVNLGGFGPVVSDGFGIGYHVSDTWLGCNATSYLDEELQEFLRCLEYSLNDIFDILEGRPLIP
uniref:Choline/carnitine acyltransferase domain-containing protein n=1 Tax=Nothoprocta perdicaria TaxID=30464 RepID=A0A8C6ZQ79_NOTPE